MILRWDWMLLNHTLCKVMDNSASWEGKFILGICIYPWPVSGGMGLFLTICLRVSRCCSQGMKPNQGLSVGLYCQHMRHSTVAKSHASLQMKGAHGWENMWSLLSCQYDYSLQEPLILRLRWPRSKPGWYPLDKLSVLQRWLLIDVFRWKLT